MYLCVVCEENDYKHRGLLEVMGDSRCPEHGLRSFNSDPLVIYCSGCAEKAQRCQICGCYVNARTYNENHTGIGRVVNGVVCRLYE